MPIRLQLLLFGVIGNVLVAAIFIFSFGYRENIQEDSSNESLLTLYESAWYQTYNKSFDVMSKWLPVTGENASFWNPDSEIQLRYDDVIICYGELNHLRASLKNAILGVAEKSFNQTSKEESSA